MDTNYTHIMKINEVQFGQETIMLGKTQSSLMWKPKPLSKTEINGGSIFEEKN